MRPFSRMNALCQRILRSIPTLPFWASPRVLHYAWCELRGAKTLRIPKHMVYPGALQLFRELDRTEKASGSRFTGRQECETCRAPQADPLGTQIEADIHYTPGNHNRSGKPPVCRGAWSIMVIQDHFHPFSISMHDGSRECKSDPQEKQIKKACSMCQNHNSLSLPLTTPIFSRGTSPSFPPFRTHLMTDAL